MTSTEHAAAMPAAPHRSFASDNAAGIHPTVLQAIVEANEGHALAYGQDDPTRAAARTHSVNCSTLTSSLV